MDTRLLTTFTVLARTGGFTAAAAELHLAQSTVTVHIRTLERDLGVRLFDRLPTGRCSPTPAAASWNGPRRCSTPWRGCGPGVRRPAPCRAGW